MPTSILLTTLNATYQHCAFGLRYLHANLRELKDSARLVEFMLGQKPSDIAEVLLSHGPAIIGISVYIWNTRQTLEVVSILKRVRPDILVVLGGPEVSFESEGQKICQLADVVVKGEGEDRFYEICRDYLADGKLPSCKWVTGALPEVARLALPYSLYTDEDIRHRVIYVEASRGCPYKCEFCLSSLDTSVRAFPLEPFLAEMQSLIDRGARRLKFVDRTFNLNAAVSARILEFFLERASKGLFLHFEMVPDRLPSELRELLRLFPAGTLQFEIGIQTWDIEVARRVSRRQDYVKTKQNFAFLLKETGVHVHADLIAGLPGETLASFGRGFDEVSELGPHEIQVGTLKRLKGAPIMRHDDSCKMVYHDEPPFAVLQTSTMTFQELQAVARFAKFWDFYANSGNFPSTVAFLRERARQKGSSWFEEFFAFSQFLDERHPQRYGVALVNLVESAWLYLTTRLRVEIDVARDILLRDYSGRIKRDIPSFLRVEGAPARPPGARATGATPGRQSRHLAVSQP